MSGRVGRATSFAADVPLSTCHILAAGQQIVPAQIIEPLIIRDPLEERLTRLSCIATTSRYSVIWQIGREKEKLKMEDVDDGVSVSTSAM